MKIFLIKWCVTQALKLVGKGITIGKKNLEKDYEYFRLFKKYKLNQKLDDSPKTIFLETVYQYEKLRSKSYAKLFYLNDGYQAFHKTYNLDDKSALQRHIDDTLHTSIYVRILKSQVVDIESEINLFLTIYKRVSADSSTQSFHDIKKSLDEIKNQIVKNEDFDVSDITKDNPINSIKKPIPREIISAEEKDSPIFYFDDKKNRSSLLDEIEIQKRIVLLANGGMGKSTELIQFCALCEEKGFVPIFRTFKTYTDESIDDLLPTKWTLIKPEHLIIILDGLDEVRPNEFSFALRKIRKFINENPLVKLVVSCRTNHLDVSLEQLGGEFTPFYLEEVSVYSPKLREFIEDYGVSSDAFVEAVFDRGFEDLAKNPFYLHRMLEIFKEKGSLDDNRVKLFEDFITSNFKFDEDKYKLTIDDIKLKSSLLLKKLEHIAISMEACGLNSVDNQQLSNIINTAEDFEILKFNKSFYKIESGEKDHWQFEHRLIQEYLAARAMAKLDFDTIIALLTFENSERIIPGWANTITFLFGLITDETTREKLTSWILEKDSHLLVKVESDNLSEDIRISLFKSIFNSFREKNLWIHSNKFTDEDLARFGKSQGAIDFLLDEITSEKNTTITKISAVRLLSESLIEGDKIRTDIEGKLLKEAETNATDENYLNTLINAFKSLKFNSKSSISKMIEIVEGAEQFSVRSSIFYWLMQASYLDDYIDYIIMGYGMTDRRISTGTRTVTRVGERWAVQECVKKLKAPDSIKSFVNYIAGNDSLNYHYDTGDELEVLIENSVIAYKNDQSLYETIFDWLVKDIRKFRHERTRLLCAFFNKTGTDIKALEDAWRLPKEKDRDWSMVIAQLINENNISFIIEQFHNSKITQEQLTSIRFDLGWLSNPHKELFDSILESDLGFKIERPVVVDHDALRKNRQQNNFNILFHVDQLQREVLNIFEKEEREKLSDDDLSFIRRNNVGEYVDLDDIYSGAALRLLRDFVEPSKEVSKVEVLKWFKDPKKVVWYQGYSIYNSFQHSKEISVSEEQKQWIKSWCEKFIETVDFKNAISFREEGKVTSFNQLAIMISTFSIKLDLEFSEDKMLEMLSFYCPSDATNSGINHIVTKIDSENVRKRIVENLTEGIRVDQVLSNHVRYVIDYNVEEAYDIVIKNILDSNVSEYERKTLLDIFFDLKEGLIDRLKTMLVTSDSPIRWKIVEKLLEMGESVFIESYLLVEIENYTSLYDIGKASRILISMQNLKGLKYFVKWIKEDLSELDSFSRSSCLEDINSIDALPELMELLEISYQREYNKDSFNRLHSNLINSLNNLAMISEKNLEIVTQELKVFSEKNASLYEDVRLLHFNIESMKDQFYSSKIQSYSLNKIKEKLILLGLS